MSAFCLPASVFALGAPAGDQFRLHPLYDVVAATALVLGVVYVVAHALLRGRGGMTGSRSVVWWAISALPIAAVSIAYRRYIPAGTGWWWVAFVGTGAAGIAWALYGLSRAIPLLRRVRPHAAAPIRRSVK